MVATHKEMDNLIKSSDEVFMSQNFNEALLYNKILDIENRLQKIENKLENVDIENRLQEEYAIEYENFLWVGKAKWGISLRDERKREYKKREHKKIELQYDNNCHECRSIVERCLELLTEWENISDLRAQIPYASLIVGKITKLKKMNEIASDEVRKKVCTLLKLVIRLNASEAVFSKEQIDLLKQGFSLLIGEHIQKDDLFELNRQMLKEKLVTMPAWE